MKEIESYREDDFRYKDFEVNDEEVKILSDYFEHKFKIKETHLLCMFSFMGDLVMVQVQEDFTWDLTPGEFEKLFGKNKLN